MMRIFALIAACALISAFLVSVTPQPAAAADPSQFDPSYIISDASFYDGAAMTEAEIQAFLASKGSALTNYRSDVASRDARISDWVAGYVYCSAFEGGTNLLASTILFRVQKACGISAKVLLVTLQKESNMVVGGNPQGYRFPLGYGCPDTAPCDLLYAGFGNQLYLASLQFQKYKMPQNNFRYKVGSVFVQYNPNVTCGGSWLDIKNWATAALYNYTPYQPDAAAFAAYPGASNSCGSFGNRNFWFIYSDWFGSPIGQVNPIGNLDAVWSPTASTVGVAGWALDFDTADSLMLHVYVDGTFNSAVLANVARPDVNAAYRGMLGNYGFSATIPVAAGSRNVCVYAINVGYGSVNTPLGCRTVDVASPAPVEPAATELGAVYRFWSDKYSSHFYTRSVAERNEIIKKYPESVWEYEAAVFGAFGTQVAGTVPVYRFWSEAYNSHFYTTSEAEKNQVIATYPARVWQYEAVAFYVYPSTSTDPETVPMVRFWSPTYLHHFYTSSAAEAKEVTDKYPDSIWTLEGEVFRVSKTVPTAAPLP